MPPKTNKSPAMTAPTAMPTFAPLPSLGSLPPVDWLVEKGGRELLLIVSVVADEAVEDDIKGKDLEVDASEVEVDSSESFDIKELEMLINLSRGVAWKVSALGCEQFLPVDGVEQQAHNSESSL